MEYDPNDNEKKSKEEKKADSQNSSDDKAGKEGGIEFGEEVDHLDGEVAKRIYPWGVIILTNLVVIPSNR